MKHSRGGWLAIAVVAAVAAGAGTGSARAQDGDGCPGWFPDFHCDRQARFDGFSAPGTAPFLFEDPFITTSLSLWGIYHEFPERSAFDGGYLTAGAAQVRVAITDRLAFIATKDGAVSIRPDSNVLGNETGYLDLAFGFKYAAIVDEENRFILTPSLRYEATNGSIDVLSGNGQGIWLPAASFGWGIDDFHVLGGLGFQLPVDGDENSTVMFYNLHLDREIADGIAPFVELNGYHYLDEGDGSTRVRLANGARVPLSTAQQVVGVSGFEGLDVLNLGSGDVENNDVLTWGVGVRAQVSERVSLGLAYERPLTTRRDIIKQRFTLNVLLEL